MDLGAIGLSIVALAGSGLLGTTVIVTRAAIRGRQAPWMARLIFVLAGAILVGNGFIALSVDLVVARGVGIAMTVTGLAVMAFAVSPLRDGGPRGIARPPGR